MDWLTQHLNEIFQIVTLGVALFNSKKISGINS